MSHGKELLESLERSIQQEWSRINNRYERIAEGSTDMDDCFVSQRMNERGIDLAKTKISILENGGVSSFACLRDIETGEIVTEDLISGKYGMCWLVPDKHVEKYGRFIGDNETAYKKKGVELSEVDRPAWAALKAGAGGGMCGAYNCYVSVFRSRKNYWTGEFVEA